MRIFVIPDIHGKLEVLEKTMLLIKKELSFEDTKLVFLGDYIHGGKDSVGVIDYIMKLQEEYGLEKIIALMGNHEEFVIKGESSLEELIPSRIYEIKEKYIDWIKSLPRYHQESNTIFVHAGIDEELGVNWRYTDDHTFTNKYPATIGKVENLDLKIVSGHVFTSEIAEDDSFSDIFFDGFSHYYLDGNVVRNNKLNIMMVETSIYEDKYYEINHRGITLISKYY